MNRTERTEPTVRVYLPLLEEAGGETRVDQTENVIINGEVTQILRGEAVEVKVPVYMQLRLRYRDL